MQGRNRLTSLRWAAVAALASVCALMLGSESALAHPTKTRHSTASRHSRAAKPVARQATVETFTHPVPPQGTWEDCDLATLLNTCQARLTTMHDVGLSFALVDPLTYDPAAIAAYAATADSLHMGLYWIIDNPGWWSGPSGQPGLAGTRYQNKPGQARTLGDASSGLLYDPSAQNLVKAYPALAAGCGCQSNGTLEQALIGMLAALPATRGYYLADNSQLTPQAIPAVSDWAARVRADDPNPSHILLIAHWGMMDSSGTDFQLYNGIGATDVNEWYPVTDGNSSVYDLLSLEASMARATHQISAAGSHLTAFFLQSFSWGDSLVAGTSVGMCTNQDTPASCSSKLRFPTAAEMTAIRNTAITAGSADLIIWYRWSGLAGTAYAPDPLNEPLSAGDLSSRLAAFAQAVQAPPPTDASVAPALCVRQRTHRKARPCALFGPRHRGIAAKARGRHLARAAGRHR
jgi:hypothetical protein